MRNSKRLKRFGSLLVAGVGLSLAVFLYAQEGTKPPEPKTGNAEEAELRSTLAAYGQAYKQGDLEKVMAFWAKDSEFVDEDGNVIRGKEALAKSFREEFANQKPESFQAKVTSLRILRSDLAMVDGTVTMTLPNGVPEMGAFNSVWTKVDGKWLILSARDLPSLAIESLPQPGSRLQPLERLMGEWINKEGDTVITINCRRANKECFLLVDQSVKTKGVETLSVTIVIGWDPQLGQIRSWVFDSAGGFGDGLWERRANEWFVEWTGVRADGRDTSSVNVWSFIDDNTLQWLSTDREIDGEPMPDMTARYVRQTEKK